MRLKNLIALASFMSEPVSVSEAEWRLALQDGGRFLDAWGPDAATMRWTAGELFDVPREGRPGGLILATERRAG